MNIEEKEKALAEKERKFMESMKGRTMAEIIEHPENKRLSEERKALADEKRTAGLPRTRMLTVRKLIDFLSKQNPDACILAYEQNSFAYIEQFPDLPNPSVCTVADAKKFAEKDWRGWFRDCEDADKRVKEKLEEEFRYAQDDDVIIEF